MDLIYFEKRFFFVTQDFFFQGEFIKRSLKVLYKNKTNNKLFA